MNTASLTRFTYAIVVLLVIQFVVGSAMTIFPPSGPAGKYSALDYVILAVHVIIGTMILGIAVRLRIGMTHFKEPGMLKPAAAGGAAVGIAYLSGIILVLTNLNIFSYIMALGFVAAMVAYAFLLGFLNSQRMRGAAISRG